MLLVNFDAAAAAAAAASAFLALLLVQRMELEIRVVQAKGRHHFLVAANIRLAQELILTLLAGVLHGGIEYI